VSLRQDYQLICIIELVINSFYNIFVNIIPIRNELIGIFHADVISLSYISRLKY